MAKKTKPVKTDVPSGRAISIQQPYLEMILRGTKKTEYRSRQTHIRGRVYLYASQKAGATDYFKKLKLQPGDLPTGVILGSVEIVGCSDLVDQYGYKLKNPKRYKTPLIPENRAQPCFFFPFGPLRPPRKKKA